MLSVLKLEPYSAVTVHIHPEEQWEVLLEGECLCIQGDEKVPMTAGDFWSNPYEVTHGILRSELTATVLDIFSPPREEYKKHGKSFTLSARVMKKSLTCDYGNNILFY